MSLSGLRRRVLLLACLLLALTCLMAVGVVCTCSSDHSLQTVQQIVQSAGSSIAAVIAVWSVGLLMMSVLVGWLLVNETDARGRASPELLQRFLF
jgi:type IV secretory pathway VirB2 component (pilin)